MDTIEQKLLLVGDLSPSEQDDLEQYVREHPEWAPLLAEARALHRLLAAARTERAAPDAAALAQYVLAQALGRTETLAADEFAGLQEALATNPELERQARTMARTLEQIAAEAEDPVQQFERLTGRRLAATKDRDPVRVHRMPRWRWVRTGLAACVALGVMYGALALVSQSMQPEQVVLADLGHVDNYEGLRLRGDGLADRTADHYALALERIDDARSSVLGLFPRYDEATLNDAAAKLREVVDESGEDSWEGVEALYMLGKVRLYQGQEDEALWAFQSVVALQGPHASEARRLLDYLQDQNGND